MDYPYECISKFIFAETDIKKSDIILIPGGSHPQLMERAAELYNRGLAKYILPSGGSNLKLPNYESEWEYLKEIGINLGVPEEVILREDKAKNTFENAELSWDVLQTLNLSWFLNKEHISVVMNDVVKIGSYFEDKIPNWIQSDFKYYYATLEK